jgi:hypothetical protein
VLAVLRNSKLLAMLHDETEDFLLPTIRRNLDAVLSEPSPEDLPGANRPAGRRGVHRHP